MLREHPVHGPDSRAIASVFREPDRSPRGIEAFPTYALAMPFLTISLFAASLGKLLDNLFPYPSAAAAAKVQVM